MVRRAACSWLLGAAALAVVVLLGIQATGFLPDFRNPFAKEQTDRSQPPLLKSIQDLSRYVAAEGNFQVVVDTAERQASTSRTSCSTSAPCSSVPAASRRTSTSPRSREGAIVQSADGKSVEIKLPAPQLGETNLDMEKSYVFAEQRGLLNRLGDLFGNDPNRQQQIYLLAEDRITSRRPGQRARRPSPGEHPQDAGGPAALPRLPADHGHLHRPLTRHTS